MFDRLNIYDVYAYFIPGFAVLAPLLFREQKVELGEAIVLVFSAYVVGSVLQACSREWEWLKRYFGKDDISKYFLVGQEHPQAPVRLFPSLHALASNPRRTLAGIAKRLFGGTHDLPLAEVSKGPPVSSKEFLKAVIDGAAARFKLAAPEWRKTDKVAEGDYDKAQDIFNACYADVIASEKPCHAERFLGLSAMCRGLALALPLAAVHVWLRNYWRAESLTDQLVAFFVWLPLFVFVATTIVLTVLEQHHKFRRAFVDGIYRSWLVINLSRDEKPEAKK